MENRIIFRERLTELKEAADAADGVLTKPQIKDILKGIPLEESHFQLIYEYLAEQNICVVESEEEAEEAKEEEVPEEGRRSLSMYVEELSAFADVDEETETHLFDRARQGDADAGQQLIDLYLPVICRIAEEYGEEAVQAEDLIQEGNMGLLSAMQTLDHFENTAACRAHVLNTIRESMDTAVSQGEDHRRMDKALVSRINHLNEAVHNLERDLGHKVSAEEVSAYLDMPVEEIEDLLRVAGDQISTE